jgi:hypothetical protein
MTFTYVLTMQIIDFQQGWEESIVISINGAGTTKYPYARECNWTPSLDHKQKLTENG